MFILPDYDNCIVNLSNSILKSFGAQTMHGTLPLADEYLAGEYKNAVILLLDAMGISILKKHLSPNGFFRSHLAGTFDSVYPPTTVAATGSLLSAMYPNEHGRLGWDMYYPELDKNVTVFSNTDQVREKEDASPVSVDESGNAIWDKDSLEESSQAAEFNASAKYTPFVSVIDRIKDAGGQAFFSTPFVPPYPADLDAVLEHTVFLCKEPGRKFIYAYWNEPDHTMHRKGTMSLDTHNLMVSLEKKIEEFASGLSDTLLFITADHGHMDGRNLCILDHPEVTGCLKRMPSIEPRTLNLFVKDECMESFPGIFRRTFGEDFLLLSREEVLRCGLFGPGKGHGELRAMIGDYVAVAVSYAAIFNTHYEAQTMPGEHAGMTKEEYEIPLIAVKCGEKGYE